MSLLSDLRVLYHIVAKPVRGKDHAARLESFRRLEKAFTQPVM